ncbi:MAG: hypothetical protein QME74_03645 [Candidatus Edwardsbacteria bacterium]|nr:hypothetical protein [Candidatus Edwardsbacteria bacterium]
MFLFDQVVPKLRAAMERTGDRTIVDLGSGGGGPVELVRAQLEQDMGTPVNAVLTDKFPTRPRSRARRKDRPA